MILENIKKRYDSFHSFKNFEQDFMLLSRI